MHRVISSLRGSMNSGYAQRSKSAWHAVVELVCMDAMHKNISFCNNLSGVRSLPSAVSTIHCTRSTLSDLFSFPRAAILSTSSGSTSCLAVLKRLRSFSLAEKWYKSERTNGCRSRMDAATMNTSWVYPTEVSSQTASRQIGRLTNTRDTRRETRESRRLFALRTVHAKNDEK